MNETPTFQCEVLTKLSHYVMVILQHKEVLTYHMSLRLVIISMCPIRVLSIVFSKLENVLSTGQCRYTVPTKNRNLPTTFQHAVAMSNNDDMEIDIDSFRGPRGTKEKRVQQKSRGNKSEHRGSEEKEREQ
jgi:hypothetical protein